MSYAQLIEQNRLDELMLKYNFALQSLETQLNILIKEFEFNNKYNQRDISARKNMRNLVDSDRNKVTNVFSTLFER